MAFTVQLRYCSYIIPFFYNVSSDTYTYIFKHIARIIHLNSVFIKTFISFISYQMLIYLYEKN